MSFDEVAQNITPMGYVAAIIGFLLCIAVLMIRFRERNLMLEKERAEHLKNLSNEKNNPDVADDTQPTDTLPQPKSPFKTFVPEDAGD